MGKPSADPGRPSRGLLPPDDHGQLAQEPGLRRAGPHRGRAVVSKDRRVQGQSAAPAPPQGAGRPAAAAARDALPGLALRMEGPGRPSARVLPMAARPRHHLRQRPGPRDVLVAPAVHPAGGAAGGGDRRLGPEAPRRDGGRGRPPAVRLRSDHRGARAAGRHRLRVRDLCRAVPVLPLALPEPPEPEAPPPVRRRPGPGARHQVHRGDSPAGRPGAHARRDAMDPCDRAPAGLEPGRSAGLGRPRAAGCVVSLFLPGDRFSGGAGHRGPVFFSAEPVRLPRRDAPHQRRSRSDLLGLHGGSLRAAFLHVLPGCLPPEGTCARDRPDGGRRVGAPASRRPASDGPGLPVPAAGIPFPGLLAVLRQPRLPLHDSRAALPASGRRGRTGVPAEGGRRVAAGVRRAALCLDGHGGDRHLPRPPVVLQRGGVRVDGALPGAPRRWLVLRANVARRQQCRLGTGRQAVEELASGAPPATAPASRVFRQHGAGSIRHRGARGEGGRPATDTRAGPVRPERPHPGPRHRHPARSVRQRAGELAPARPPGGRRRARVLHLRHSAISGSMSRQRPIALAILFGAMATARAESGPGVLETAAAPRAEAAAGIGRFTTVVHGWAFLTSNRQGGRSGDQDFESQNHVMIVSSRPVGSWTLTLLGTFTAEPMTVPRQGAPALFQRGETYKDVLLVDRQHAHDLFVELGTLWSRGFAKRSRFRLYLAPWGEPAVGPTVYVHRLSASANPTAPLAHHNQDSTHISADVVTAALDMGPVSVEGSVFHGREPDENRWDIEQGSLDSYSGRIWMGPARGLRLQVSAARREHPEALEEGDQTRQTASIEYERTTTSGFVAAALISGRNLLEGGHEEWGNTLEATWKFAGKNTVYGRAEKVDRDLYELVNKSQRPETTPERRTSVDALTLGYLRDLNLLSEAETALGAGVTMYRFDDRLDPVYGDRPLSVQVFVRLRFGSKGAEHHHHAALPGVPARGATGIARPGG